MRSLVLLLSFAAACGAQPVVDAITNAADYSGRVSPGSIATLFGSDFTNEDPAGAAVVPLTFSLAGVSVSVNGISAPMFYAGPTQVNFQIPYEVPAGAADLVLQSPTGATAAIPFTVDVASPGVLQYGTDRAIAVNYSDGALNADDDPVAAGGTLIVYLTGVGPVTTTPADGDANSSTDISYANSVSSASIGGVNAPVDFLGLAPGYVGLGQANITVPALANGDYPLTITVNGAASVSATVSVSGPGTPPPSILSYLSIGALPIPYIQNTLYSASDIQVYGTDAYVCGPDEITVLDVSNAHTPVSAGSFGSASLNAQGGACKIDQGYLVEIVNTNQFLVYDLTTSYTNPQLVAGPIPLQAPGSTSLVFDGNTAAFATTGLSSASGTGQIVAESGFVEIYNFANFAAPVYAATFTPPADYTANTAPRFQTADLGNSYIAVAGTTNDGVTNGGESTSGEGQLTVIDILDPANPVAASEVVVPQTVVLLDIALQGSIALITGNTQAWSNPLDFASSNPQPLNHGDLTLTIADFTNPQSPQVLSTVDSGYQASNVSRVVSLGGGFFAVAIAPPVSDFDGASTLAVVDARNTAALSIYPVATINGLSSLAVSGPYLFVPTAQGLNVYTITLPAS